MSLRGGSSLVEVVSQLEAWGARAVSGKTDPGGMSGPARIAAATALADAESKLRGVPLHEFLAPGSSDQPIVCNATLTAGPPEDVIRQAEWWAEDGFMSFKLKLGVGDDLAQVAAVRESLGVQVKIRIDANGSWDANDAAAKLAALEPFGIELAEQPVASLDDMARLRKTSPVPLVADESVFSVEGAEEALKLAACDAITVKLSKTGSLDASLGGLLPTYLSSALDGPVGIAAAAHVAQTLPSSEAFPDLAQGLATSRLFATTVAEKEAVLSGPLLRLPGGPGLGVTIDEKALNRHRL